MCNCMKPRSNERAHCAPEGPPPERRRDLVTGLLHVLAAGRTGRPNEFRGTPSTLPTEHMKKSCPFCRGREDETTPTLAWFHRDPMQQNEQSWQVRVVENLYPAFISRDPLDSVPADVHQQPRGAESQDDPPCKQASLGHHRVLIESPEHHHSLTELSRAQVALVLRAYQHQFREFAQTDWIRSALIFKNQGRLAGMSREHVHSQVVALPYTPPLLQLELEGSQAFYRDHRQCVFCHLANDAKKQGRVVLETDAMIAYCPYASRTAYEVWLQPKQHQAHLADAQPSVLEEAADGLHQLLRTLLCLELRAYNFVIHSAPFDITRKDHYHWHIEIIPRSSFLAGLEFGAGVLINTVAPEAAAEDMRQWLLTNND